MLKDKLNNFFVIQKETIDSQKSTLLLGTIISVTGIVVIAAVEALGLATEKEEDPSTS